MSRSLFKGPYIHPHIFKINHQLSQQKKHLGLTQPKHVKNIAIAKGRKNLDNYKNLSQESLENQTLFSQDNPELSTTSKKLLPTTIKIWARNSIILPNFIGSRVQIYNGKKFIPIKILPEMVGFKFGSFSATRKFTKKFSSKKR